MAKSVIKELIIVLLLCLAIVLILGILFYEYIPISKEVPEEVNYSISDDVQQKLDEIDENLRDEKHDEDNPVTDSVTSTDLNNYERVKDYRPGKANPFGPYETTATDPSGSGSSTGGSSSSSGTTGGSTSTTDDDDSSSGGHFFQNTGTK